MDGLWEMLFVKVKDKLRKAGSSLREFDDAYAAKVAEGAHPLVQMTSDSQSRMHRPAQQRRRQPHTGCWVNAAARYALPAGGVTLAGKGLYDLTQMMMDQQSSGTIGSAISKKDPGVSRAYWIRPQLQPRNLGDSLSTASLALPRRDLA